MRLLPALTAAALACAVVPVQAQTPARPAAKAGKKSAATLEAEAKAAAEAEAKAKADAAAAAAAAAAADDAAKAKAAADAEAAARAAESKAAAERAAAEARGLEARIRILADALALPMKRLPGDHRDQRFAVMPFESAGPEAQERSLGLVVSDLLTTGLVRDHRLPLTERSQIGTVMTELALQQSGAVDDAQAAQVGKLAAARAIVVGRVSDGGDFFLVSARAVDSESGAVVVATEARLPKAELIAFSADAVVLKSRSGAMFRSMVAPGWGQSYNGDDAKAFVLGGITVGAAASTVVVGGLGLYNGFLVYPNAHLGLEEQPAKASQAVESARVAANTQLTAAAVLAGITAVAWGVTAAEAWLSGTDVDSLDAALAKN